MLGATLALGAMMAVPAVLPVLKRAPLVTPDRQQLLALLQDLRAAWRPADLAAVRQRVDAAAAQLPSALHWLLAQTHHPLLPQAVAVAGMWRQPDLLPDLLALQQHPDVRGAALLAADAIEPLEESAVESMVDDPDGRLALAGVQIAARRQPPLAELLLAAMRHPAANVRQAALSALPAELPATCAAAAQSLAADEDVAIAGSGMLALARCPFTPGTEDFLAAQAARDEVELARASLTALAAHAESLQPSTWPRLWRLLADAATDHRVVAAASLCLERGVGPELDTVLRQARSMGDLGRYFAARIAIAHGSQAGVDLLLDLLGDGGADAPEPQGEARAVRFAARSLLAWLAHTPAGAGVEAWRGHFAATPHDRIVELPAPALDR